MAFFKKNEKDNSSKNVVKIKKKSSDITTIISSNTVIDGNLTIDGHLDLSGEINGDITCGSIIVRDVATVNGDVTATASVKISGKIKGTVKGKSVFLYDDCHMEGTVYQESLIIEDGAFLDGQCKRLTEDTEDDNVLKKEISSQ